jgi:1-acyl-sn-glycerol-3-phosphate acyltransferase
VTTAPQALGLASSTDAGSGLRAGLRRQRFAGRLASFVCIPLATFLMRFAFRWRIRDVARSRAEFARVRGEDSRPLLVAANHLTMADSALIAWGLGSTSYFLRHYASLPWNVPEQSRVESSWLWRVLAYLMKCVPVPRGGQRRTVARVIEGLRELMRRGEVVLMFPEAGRSRSGRIERESLAQGVGRLIQDLGDCRVLCVYMRGDRQRSWSNMPCVGDTFSVATRLVEPRTGLRGVRASRELACQVLDHLVEMEDAYWSGR